MKKQNYNFFVLITVISLFGFTQCASTKKLEQEAPMNFTEAYYQNWVAGVKGGGSGTNIFIQAPNRNIILDSVFFQNKMAKLSTKNNNNLLYIGRLTGEANTSDNQVNENNPNQDGKTVETNFPFQLKDNECVVSYMQNDKRKYYKISELVKKPMEKYPMSRKQEDNKM